MTIFMENKETGLSCGINDDGNLFMGDNNSGYNLPDTPENRERVIKDFKDHNTVTTICYGQKRVWASRSEARAFFFDGAMNCEGAEAERYYNILDKLDLGYDVCDDSDPDDEEPENETKEETTMYVHTTKGTLATLESDDGKRVKLTTENGESLSISAITFRRWWKKTEESAPASETKTTTPAKEDKPEDKPEAKEPVIKKTNAEPMTMSAVITTLESLFDKLNELYYENKLPRPVITVQSTPRAYGHCSTKKVWVGSDSERYEINIGAEFLNRPIEETAATLNHEMVHLYCLVNEISDTCQNGRYHNKTFKAEAEARDLEIEYNRTIGYSITSPTEALVNKLKASGFDMTIDFARTKPEAKEGGKETTGAQRIKPHKYFCPCCGQSFRTTATLHLKCADCDEDMEVA